MKAKPFRVTGEQHPLSKLTKKQVIEIKKLILIDGMTAQDVAYNYKVSESTFYDIKFGRTWAHV